MCRMSMSIMNLFLFCLCLVYMFAGTCAFIAFLILRFYLAAIFGFITAFVSGVTAHLNWLYSKNHLTLWYDVKELIQIHWFGLCILILGSSSLVYHVAFLIMRKQYELNYIISAIWSFITLKAALLLVYFTRKHTKYQRTSDVLVNEESHE